MVDDILTKVDRMSMAVSLEAREPLLDHRLLEFAASIPTSLKLRNGRSKYLLRKLLDRRVPRSILERGKRGFDAPIGEWLRGPLAPMAETRCSTMDACATEASSISVKCRGSSPSIARAAPIIAIACGS